MSNLINIETAKYSLEYWKEVVPTQTTMEPSAFSKFCLSYIPKGDNLLSICCGNGRDSFFFKENGLDVSAFDIQPLRQTPFNFKELNLLEKPQNFGYEEQAFGAVYCRFILHSIPEDLEDYLLANAFTVLQKGGILCIEARSDKGIIINNNHYRRLINIDVLKQKLFDLNFQVEFVQESDGLSVYNGENPVLIRIIARKIGILNPVDCEYMLLKTKYLLDKHNIRFFLIFGTLLGAYRDHAFIPYDKDVDIGLFEEDKIRVQRLVDKGDFKYFGLHYTGNNFKRFSTFLYKNEYLDLFYFRSGLAVSRFEISKIKSRFILAKYGKLQNIHFLGTSFLTVGNIEAYLKDAYGDDWKTPIRLKGATNW